MTSLFLHNISTVPQVILPQNDLRAKQKMNMVKLGYKKHTRNSTIYSQVNGTSLGNKEVASDGNITEKMKSKEKVSSKEGLGITKFLKGKVLFVTGSTGFLAKVLVEKILRTIPDVDKIYLLLKAKDKDVALERLNNEIMDTDLFKIIRQSHGKSHKAFMLNKLIPVIGNVCESDLGIDAEVLDHIVNEVDIIVNSAANTNADDSYDDTLDINTLGPCRILSFAKRCKRLKLFMHVSTAYVNGTRQGIVFEKPFNMGDSITKEKLALESSMGSFPILDVEAEIKLALDTRVSCQDNTVTQKMKNLGEKRANFYGWQNTYVFTKAMGEMMIGIERQDIPVVIIRPSIIESTYKEPIPGWIEGIRMVDPVIITYGKGEMVGFPGDPNGVMDTIPADTVVNAMLAAMAKHGKDSKAGLNIYQVASSVTNPLLYHDLFSYSYEYFSSTPYKDKNGRPIKVQRAKIFDSINEFFSYIETEALNASRGMVLSRRQQRSLDTLKHMAYIYEPYVFFGGRFDTTNMQKLMEDLSQEEAKIFDFDVRSIDWKDYICNVHIPGLLRHALKGRGL